MSNVIEGKKITVYSVISPIIVLVALCIAWFMLYAQEQEIVYLPDPVNGISDASKIDFNEDIGRISREMEFYPMELYTSEDFESGDVIEPQNRSDVFEAYKIPYGTHKTVLKLQPNTYYSITGYSVDYGTRIFVNGEEAANVGVVSNEAETSKPGVNFMEFPIRTDESGVVELIIQYSNFVHKEGGSTPFLYISSPENINRYIINRGLPTYIMSGGLVLLGAYYFLDGVLRKKRMGLQLSFCCILFALRDQWFYIVSLIPYDYDWNIHYRVIVMIIALTPLAVLTMIESAFEKLIPKVCTLILSGITVAGVAIMFLIPTTLVADFSDIVQIITIPYALYLVFSIIKYYIKKKKFQLKDVYTIIAIGILIFATVVDLLFSDNLPAVTRGGITPIGMLLFVIVFMSVLVIKSSEDEIALEKTHRENEMLGQMNSMKTEFFQKMAHEIKTPLTVMSGYAQLTNIQIVHNEVNESTTENLKVISLEAKRLSDLVSNLLEMPTTHSTEIAFEKIHIKQFLQYVSIICKEILKKNGNEMFVAGETDLYISGNMEMLVQMILNFMLNSNKNMNNGKFTLEIQVNKDNQTVNFKISDTGKGITSQNAMHIFDKGFSTDGTKGLGLHICKEIAELHGGVVSLESKEGEGAVFNIKGIKIAE